MKGKNKEIIIAHPLDKLWMLPNKVSTEYNKVSSEYNEVSTEYNKKKYHKTVVVFHTWELFLC